MKTTFSKNVLTTIAIAIPMLILVSGLVWLLKSKGFPQTISIDFTEDGRGLGYIGQQKIVADQKGNLYVTYRKKHQRFSEIFVAKVFSSSQWGLDVSGTALPVAVVGLADQRVPSVAVDSKGVVHVVWYGSDTAGEKNSRQIKYARSLDEGRTWSSWRNVSFVSGFESSEELWQEHPSLLVGKDDRLYVVWEGKDEKNNNQQIKFSSSSNGGTTWEPWKNVNVTENNTQSRPSLVEDPTGKIYLFMYSSSENANGTQQVRYSESLDKGATWSSWQTLSNPEFDSRHVSAVSDSKGNVYVVWRSPAVSDGPSQIFYRVLSGGKGSRISAVYSNGSRYQFFPSIGIVKTGQTESIFVSWWESGNSSEFPREEPSDGEGFVSSFANGNFQEPLRLNQGERVLYPSVPGKIEDERLPVVYEQRVSDQRYEIKLEFLEGGNLFFKNIYETLKNIF